MVFNHLNDIGINGRGRDDVGLIQFMLAGLSVLFQFGSLIDATNKEPKNTRTIHQARKGLNAKYDSAKEFLGLVLIIISGFIGGYSNLAPGLSKENRFWGNLIELGLDLFGIIMICLKKVKDWKDGIQVSLGIGLMITDLYGLGTNVYW